MNDLTDIVIEYLGLIMISIGRNLMTNDTIYQFNGKVYCELDVSPRYENYCGDLYDLFLELRDSGEAEEYTQYRVNDPDSTEVYENHEDLIEYEFEHLKIGEALDPVDIDDTEEENGN